jgi:hypothetical protein
VRHVHLGEETPRRSWWRLIADDVGHRAVAEGLVDVEGV